MDHRETSAVSSIKDQASHIASLQPIWQIWENFSVLAMNVAASDKQIVHEQHIKYCSFLAS